MPVRKRIAFFNPIFAHYRGALLRELQASRQCEYFLFGDTQDRYGRIPVCDLSSDPHFRLTPYVRLLRIFAWQKGTVSSTLGGEFDAYILEGDAYYLSTWLGAILAKLRRRRVLFWSHGWTRTDHGIKSLVRRLFYRLADGLLLYGDRARSIGIASGFAADRLYVMYNSLDFDHQQRCSAAVRPDDVNALRRELFGPDSAPIVIATARLTERKRFDLLIRALGIVNRRGRRVDLLLVGDGPARPALESLAQAQGVRVAFAGACYEESDLARYFACACLTAMPGEVGLTCMHSLGYGVPVVTHSDASRQMPEFEAIVPGVTGDLFAPEDVEDLAQKLDRWTQHTTVPQTIREACLARIETRYHARYQARAIELALSGAPAGPGNEALPLATAPRALPLSTTTDPDRRGQPARVNLIKRSVASLLHGIRVTPLSFSVQRACLSPFVRVIYYHDVQPRMADRFEEQLRLFKRLFAPASRDDLEALLTRGLWPHERPGVILTFDDGLRSHAEVVAPLLEKHGFQGWFFIPVGLVTLPVAEQPAAAARHDVLHDCDTAQDPRIFMTPRQVAAIADSHIVGCHTATHLRLSADVTEMDLGAELRRAKQRLEALLGGRRVDSFSWVGGEEWAYSQGAAKIVARLFDYAFTTNTCVARAGTPRLNISRTHIEPFFSHSLVRLQLSGMMDLYYRPKRKRLRSSLAPCSSTAAPEG